MSDLAQQMRKVYDRLWIDCEEITQDDAVVLNSVYMELGRLRALLADRHESRCATNREIPMPCNCGALEFCKHDSKLEDGSCINFNCAQRSADNGSGSTP